MRGGEPLHDTPHATTVRARNGETVTTDGPFAETEDTLTTVVARRASFGN